MSADELDKAGAAKKPVLMLDTGGHMAVINDIAFTPDGRQLVSASDDKTIRVWDLATGRTLRSIRGESAPGHPGKVFAMALSLDGKWLAAGGLLAPFDGSNHIEVGAIRLYDFASGKLVALLKGHENIVLGLAFSPDGRHLISGSGDETAILWDVGAAKLKHRLTGHSGQIYAVGFSPDGARAVTGAWDHDLRLWRVADGGAVARMTGHSDKVQSLTVAPEGTIASGHWSGEIRLWDGRTGAAVRMLARQETVVGSLSVSPDGRTLLSGAGEGLRHRAARRRATMRRGSPVRWRPFSVIPPLVRAGLLPTLIGHRAIGKLPFDSSVYRWDLIVRLA
jgi:WD40 repeat protein